MKRAIIVISVILLLSVSGYFIYLLISVSSICEVIKNPRKYSEKEITIKGKVTSSFSLLGNTFYELQDLKSECAIKVLSNKMTPNKGEIIKIRGKLEEEFSLGSERLIVFVEE